MLGNTPVSKREQSIMEEYINYMYVVEVATPKPMAMSKIQAAIASDKTLQAVILALRYGNWDAAHSRLSDLTQFNADKKLKE